MKIAVLEPARLSAALPALVDILRDAVDGGASVNFLPPFGRAAAEAYWEKAIAQAMAGERLILGGSVDGALLGTVQLAFAPQPNQPHRADVQKLLVHRRARRRGLGAALMAAVETEAARRGRRLLTLDTRQGDAGEALYRRFGYVELGVIPRYAVDGRGGSDACVFFWKEIAGAGVSPKVL